MYLEPIAPEVTKLIDYARSIDTVDTHQHLSAEVPLETDLCRMIASDNYVLTDLVTAGLSADDQAFILDGANPLLARWGRLRPYWQQVRHGSYARAIVLTLRASYGAVDLATEDEVEAVSARVTADFAAPGLFRRVFGERCRIPIALTQPGFIPGDAPRFYTLDRPLDRADFTPGGAFERDAADAGVRVVDSDDLVAAMDAIVRRAAARGAVGMKMAALAWRMPGEAEVVEAFRRRADAIDYPIDRPNPLVCLYVARIAAIAAELNLTVAVHSSAPWTNWLDFRVWEPTAFIPFLQAFRDTRFDLYHAGMPYGTTASMLSKVFPNVWQNLAWSHVVSPELSMRSVAEWLDLLPVNKISAFGGDYQNWTVPFTEGHLALARENVARVLGYRIRCGQLGHDDACALIRAWFYENPFALYQLPA